MPPNAICALSRLGIDPRDLEGSDSYKKRGDEFVEIHRGNTLTVSMSIVSAHRRSFANGPESRFAHLRNKLKESTLGQERRTTGKIALFNPRGGRDGECLISLVDAYSHSAAEIRPFAWNKYFLCTYWSCRSVEKPQWAIRRSSQKNGNLTTIQFFIYHSKGKSDAGSAARMRVRQASAL